MSLRSNIQTFASLLIFGLSLSATSVMAESHVGGQIMMALFQQQNHLDQQIGSVEKKILETQQRSIPLKISRQIVASSMVENHHDHISQKEDGISMLDEYTVEDTYLDPFDEHPSTVVQDPWEGFNSAVFDFNLGLDRRVIRPVAKGYHALVPDAAEEALGNAFSNVRIVPRLTNNLLQGKVSEAGVVVSRFLINSTIGLAGLFDVAEAHFGLTAPVEEDGGQTLAKLGMGTGPYLVLPLFSPTTIRDGVGTLADLAMDPLNYVLPFVAQASKRVSGTVNDRAQNLDTFEGIEDSTIDLYAAVRDAYGQTRVQAIEN